MISNIDLTNPGWTAALIAAVGLLLTFLYFRRQTKSSFAQSELQWNTNISNCRSRYREVCAEIEKVSAGRSPTQLSADEKRQVQSIELRRVSTLEDLFNAYEVACAQYRDNKVDKIRFKRTYHQEIQRIVEGKEPSYVALLHPEGTSRYKAIWLVYREWFHLE